jgi:hypothetical protein
MQRYRPLIGFLQKASYAYRLLLFVFQPIVKYFIYTTVRVNKTSDIKLIPQ